MAIATERALDLLFVWDNTVSEPQYELIASLPRLFESLARGGAPGAEGSFAPIESMHVGVVTTDMGTGPSGACGDVFGDDGLLQTDGNTANPACLPSYPPWLSFGGREDTSALISATQCITSALGFRGCGFEQPLDAMLKALTPSASGIRFAGGTVGHGDGGNEGFLRAESVLAVILMTDEDDCSASDTGLFDPDDPRFGDNLNLRCHEHPEAVHPVQRYVDGLLLLRDPSRIVFAVLGGVPPDAVPIETEPLTPQLETLLADPRMESRPSELDSTQLMASCDTPGLVRARPPERIVELGLRLRRAGSAVWVDTICAGPLDDPIDRIVRTLAATFGPSCLTNAIERQPDGSLPCRLVETVAGTCGPNRVSLEADEAGRSRCAIDQRVALGTVPTEPGWYYDDFSPAALGCSSGPWRIAFSGGFEPVGSLELACEARLGGSAQGVGTSCGDDGDCGTLEAETFPLGFECTPATGSTCQPRCEADRDCGGDFRCDAEAGICTCY